MCARARVCVHHAFSLGRAAQQEVREQLAAGAGFAAAHARLRDAA